MTAAGCKPDAEDLRAFDLLFENLKNCETAQRKDKKIYMQVKSFLKPRSVEL